MKKMICGTLAIALTCGIAASFAGRAKSQRPSSPGLTLRAAPVGAANDRPFIKGGGVPLAPPELPVATTLVETQPGLAGEALTFQRRIARMLSTNDPFPVGRAVHFGWCIDPAFQLDGWNARIEWVEPAEGGTRVAVSVTPRLRGEGMGAITVLDQYREYYLLANGALTFLDGEAPMAAGEGSFIVD